MAICPNGHRTAATDYCDTCGAPVATSGAAASEQSAPAPADARACPNCGTPNAPDTLFCESCGFDFTTGASPQQVAVSSLLDLDAPLAPVNQPAQADSADRATPPEADRPAPTPAGSAADREPDRAQATVDAPESEGGTPAPAAAPAAEQSPAPVAAAPVESPAPSGAHSRSATPLPDWSTVAEVWIDPDWYRLQEADDPMPSPGLPVVVPLRRTRSLIGRLSRSRGIEPEVDCGQDSSVSRRQAELTTDGRRWWVEDLGSANGTYVGSPAQPLPRTPIAQRTELNPGDRLYVGAWTRIVLRDATPDERAAYDA